MQKFVRLLSAVAIVTVLACGSAFAAVAPVDLALTTDAYAISEDQANSIGDLLVSYDVASDKTDIDLMNFEVFIASTDVSTGMATSADILLSNDLGYFGYSSKDYGKVSFDKLLIRTTANEVELKFDVVSVDWDSLDTARGQFWFGLVGGYENDTRASKTGSAMVLAKDCTLECDYFYHSMQHVLISDDQDTSALLPTLTDTVKWDGTGNHEFYVECCDDFALALLSGDESVDFISSDLQGRFKSKSQDMVFAHLSETPFLRVRTNEAKSADKSFRDWKNNYFDDVVDVPEGETYNMGVQYAISTDCSCCAAGACCTNDYVPFLAVTNLGTAAVYNANNILDSTGLVLQDNNEKVKTNDSWLCNAWCGLCEYDDFMSGDKGLLGAGDAKIADQSALSDCPCHIYPAFTNTVKTAGNMDINYRANKTADGKVDNSVVTKIAGRFNTSWSKFSVGTGGLCATCENDIDLYKPCDCLVETYVKALGTSVKFVVDADKLTLTSYNDVITDDAAATASNYAVVDAVITDTASKDILLTKLNWTLTGANLTDAGLVDGTNWWRSDMWNKLKITINGIDLNSTSVTNVSGPNDLTAAELSFLTVIDGPQRTLTATTDVDVNLFVFVVDSDTAAVKYYSNTKGNRFLVVYDGAKDGKFSYKAYVSKATDAPVSADFAVAPTALELNLNAEDTTTGTLTAANAPEGAEIVWTVASTDFATVSPAIGATTTVTGVAVGEVVVTAMVSGDDTKSADCTVTVIDEAPVTPDTGSGGGCNAAGFAPAMLLLVTPLVFFLKK